MTQDFGWKKSLTVFAINDRTAVLDHLTTSGNLLLEAEYGERGNRLSKSLPSFSGI